MSHESNFVSKYLQAISLSFYIKYARKKCWENFLSVFLGVHAVQMVPKHARCGTDDRSNTLTYSM